MKEIHGRTIVLVPFPYQGHLNPILQLAKVLHSMGISITIAHSTLISLTNHDFTFLPIPDGLSPIDASSISNDVIKAINVRSKRPLREKLSEMMTRKRIACLIYDSILVEMETVANDLGIASIVFDTVSAAVVVTNMAYPLFQQEGFIPLQG